MSIKIFSHKIGQCLKKTLEYPPDCESACANAQAIIETLLNS